MTNTLKSSSAFLLFCVMTAVLCLAEPPQARDAGEQPALSQAPGSATPDQSASQATPPQLNPSSEESSEEELAPAAVERDMSRFSPLIQELYAATRETKERAILARLDKANELLEGGADVTATDAEGRTPLHWRSSAPAIALGRKL